MAALNFPSSPTLNQTYSANGKIFRWNGVSWNNITGTGDYFPVTVTTASSLSPDLTSYNLYIVTALDQNITINAPIGPTQNGTRLMFRIKGDATEREISWNAIYKEYGVTLPTLTTPNKYLYIGCFYNSDNLTWDVVSLSEEV
jgi:hypothetical protein